ncbi:hypothetical protein CDD83_273 [Cordyceps sp. RAO-2017]|nr:hypothetical protein CDD83_273 [Cordyceps sp. RAO-2017]
MGSTAPNPNDRPADSGVNFSGPPASSGPQLTVERRHDKSMLMTLLLAIVKPFRPRLVISKGSPGSGSPRLSAPKKVLRDHKVEERSVENIWIYDVTPIDRTAKEEASRPRSSSRRIYYFAGGGWQSPASPHHWAFVATLADRLPQTTVSLVSYPLAPDNPASVSMPRLKTLYHTLMQQSSRAAEHVVMAGDSSGGNVALSLVLWALASEGAGEAAGHSHPVAIMAICPTTDLRHNNADIQAVARRDPIMTIPFISSTAGAWCAAGHNSADPETGQSAQWTAEDPRVSPILGPVELFARHGIKIHGVVGMWDVLAPESMEFVDRCRELGVGGQWLVWEGQMHCFPLAFRYGLRESVQALDWISRVLGEGGS